MGLSVDPWVWIAAGLTICIYSFLYKDNPFYKFAEHLFVGVSVGYSIALTYWRGVKPKVIDPLVTDFAHEWLLVFAIIIGLMYFCRFIPKVSWMIRWPLAISLGFACGVSIPLTFQAQLYEQVRYTMEPFAGYGMLMIVNGILIVVGVVSCLVYFFFSARHTGALGTISRVGIIFLMLGFGASFGNTVMARVTLLIGRVGFLLSEWLGLPIVEA